MDAVKTLLAVDAVTAREMAGMKKYETNLLKNKEMSGDTYKLRRQVMELIYEAKELLNGNMPRITIRIAEHNGQSNALGVGRMGKNIIWIEEKTLKMEYLREVVYHELCHAIWAINHNEECPLMSSTVGKKPLKKSEVQKLFLKYAGRR
jgi:hypothetical protein